MYRNSAIALLSSAGILAMACNERSDARAMPATSAQTVTSPAVSPSAAAAATLPKRKVDPGAGDSPVVSEAVAVLNPTEGNHVTGEVTFKQTSSGLNVHAEFKGLSPGEHAFHVHLFGDCSSDDAKSAGTHFNFQGSSEAPPKDIQRITGNLGEVKADESGSGSVDETIEKATLTGPYSIVGRSVVVHEKGNDPKSPPIGAAGGRVACGVIGIKNT